MTISNMPQFYPQGGPLNWSDEQSGKLTVAVLNFFTQAIEPGAPFTPEQFELVRAYGEYYLNAPCWDANPHHDDETRAELARLRRLIKEAKTVEDINAWVHACLDSGIDPY